MLEKLKQRQQELTKEFDELNLQRQKMLDGVREAEIRLNQLTGAYQEIQKQIDELAEAEKKHENKT
jgi:hypothetical protein